MTYVFLNSLRRLFFLYVFSSYISYRASVFVTGVRKCCINETKLNIKDNFTPFAKIFLRMKYSRSQNKDGSKLCGQLYDG